MISRHISGDNSTQFDFGVQKHNEDYNSLQTKTMERHTFLRLTCMAGQAKAWLVTFERVCLARFFRSNINRAKKKIEHSHILMIENLINRYRL